MKKDERIKVQIDGMNFVVTGNDNAEYVLDIAKELDGRIKKVTNSNFRLNQTQVLILTALNILDEKEKLEEKYSDLSSISTDMDHAKENLEELEQLKNKIAQEQENVEKYKEMYEKHREDLNYYKKVNEKIVTETQDTKSNLSEALDSIGKLEKEIKELKDKNYKDQMKIVDLNKEISILKNDEE